MLLLRDYDITITRRAKSHMHVEAYDSTEALEKAQERLDDEDYGEDTSSDDVEIDYCEETFEEPAEVSDFLYRKLT